MNDAPRATGRRAGRAKTAARGGCNDRSAAGPRARPGRRHGALARGHRRDHGGAARPRRGCTCSATPRGPTRSRGSSRSTRVTLEPVARSADLAGGPTWPGGLAAHANGSLHVVFGNHAHRLGPDLDVLASRELPRHLPYNSFVVVARRPPRHEGLRRACSPARIRPRTTPEAAELLVLDPETLEIVARCTLPEPSIARLSADGDTVYVVGTSTLYRAALGRHAPRARHRLRGRVPHDPGPDVRMGRRARARRGVVPRQRRGQRALHRDVPRPRHLARAVAPRTRRPRDRQPSRSPRSAASPTVWSRTRPSSTSHGASSSATTAATACSPRSTSPTTAARRRAGGASRTTHAIRCCSPTPASSSRTITTRPAWPTRSWCSTSSRGRERVRVDAGQRRAVRAVPRRRLRSRLLLLLVRGRDPGRRPGPEGSLKRGQSGDDLLGNGRGR